MGGYNAMCLTQKVIDAYLMQDGKTIEEARATGEYSETGNSRVLKYFSGYRLLRGTNNMYVNREMRFYACVGFNGCYWPGTSCTNTKAAIKLFIIIKEEMQDPKLPVLHNKHKINV